jgi:hypothetical protein
MADLSRQNSKEKSCPVFSLSFGMQIGTVIDIDEPMFIRFDIAQDAADPHLLRKRRLIRFHRFDY